MARLFLQVRLEPSGQFGPGKAELLERVRDTGSIRSAAAAMKMSYRRAWLLLAEMEKMFGAPVIRTATGGAKGGGTVLTDLGKTLIRRYRSIEKRAAAAAAPDLKALTRLRQTPASKR
jgi:molybdate transport system regulatory protein